MTTSQTLRCTAALLAGCLIPGVAATASAATTPTITASATTGDPHFEESAHLKLSPEITTVPEDGTSTVRVNGWVRSMNPSWKIGEFTFGDAPAGITTRFVRDGSPNEFNSGTLTLTHTGKTTAKVGTMDITVTFPDHIVTKTLTINLPEGVGEGQPVNGPRSYTDHINATLDQPASGRIVSKYIAAESVRIAIDLTHRCSARLGLTVTTPDGQRNVLKRANNEIRCTTWAGERGGSYKMRSQSHGEWVLEVTGSEDKDAVVRSWKLEFDHG